MPNKIKISVSSCLLGEAVRYDGTDKHIKYITEQLALDYNLISLCPEMSVGMGVPRPPIHLLESKNNIQVVSIDNPENNMTFPENKVTLSENKLTFLENKSVVSQKVCKCVIVYKYPDICLQI